MGTNTTKIHAIVDGLGNPIYFVLTAGSEHDCVCALDLLSKVNIEGSNILADKAYGSLKIREYITFPKASYYYSIKILFFRHSKISIYQRNNTKAIIYSKNKKEAENFCNDLRQLAGIKAK